MSNTAPHQQPGFVDRDTTNSNGNTAQSFRYALGGLMQPAPLQIWSTAG